MFVIAVGAILLTVILLLACPFWRRGGASIPLGHEASDDQERIDLEIERQRLRASLSELEMEKTQGRLTPADYQRLKNTDERYLVKVLDKIEQLASPPQTGGLTSATKKMNPRSPQYSHAIRWAGPLILGLLVVGSSSSIYSYVSARIGLEARQTAQERSASGGQGMPNPLEMVARLEVRLRENPNDLQGQIMAGRSYMALNRLEEAKQAWSKVLELNRKSHEAHYHLGLILLQENDTTDPRAYEQALAHFDAALINVPREPAVLWYKGVALVHLKRYPEADESWTTAFQNLPVGSEDAEFVKDALQNLRTGKPPLF